MQISHAYSQTVADGTATSVVRPSDWNSNHNIVLNLSGNTLGSSRLTGQALTFVGGNNITLSADTANSRLNFVGPSQSVQTQPAGNIAGAGYTSTTQNGSTVGLTHNSQGLSAAWPAFLTTQTVQTQASGNIARTGYTSTTQNGSTVGATLNTNGLSMAWPAFLTTYVGQTTQTQPAGNIAGVGTTFNGVNISGSITLNSNGINLSLSAPAGGTGGGGADGVNIVSMGSSGNSMGTAWSSAQASIGLYGAGAVSISQNNSNQIQISAPPVSSMYAGANITLASAGNSVSIIGQAAGAPDRRFKEIYPGERFTTLVGLSATQITNRAMFIPFWMEGTGLVPNTARLMMSFGASSNRSLGGTFRLGLYYQTNSTQLSLVTSNSWSASITASSQSSAWNGIAWVDFNLGGYTITAEGRYVLALQVNPVSANATWMAVSLYGGDTISSQSRVWNNGTTQALRSNSQFIPFWGAYSTTSAGLPNTVGLTQINGASSQFQLQYYAALREI